VPGRPDISTAAAISLLIVLTDSPVEARGRSVLGKLRDDSWYDIRSLQELSYFCSSTTKAPPESQLNRAKGMLVYPTKPALWESSCVRSGGRNQCLGRRCEVATAELFAREVPGPVPRASTRRRLGVGETRVELTSHDDRRDE
jgi:hypothetical protein